METTDIAVKTVEETAAEKDTGRAVPESQIEAEGAERDLAAEFEELIRGEYKDVFAARVKSILVRRFRDRTKNAATGPEDRAEGRAESAAVDESEIEALRRDYPEFELENESADPNFSRLLSLGADLRTAYEFVHRDTLMPRALNAALEAELLRSAAESGSAAQRISEGSRNAGSAVLSVDTASRSAREALERRALRGEKIIL
ncbi:MAG: hypothetical protein IJC50_05430 [Clostridia bacterium]|nr:hypothetical protein [Clostridia bacterium]